jgi:hypothetical protein
MMHKIGQYYFNLDSITWIIDREVFFNNGKSLILTEPEIQELFAIMFNEPRQEKTLQSVSETLQKPKNVKNKKQ